MLRFAFCALFFAGLASSGAQQLPPGVSAGAHLASLPLPRSGYQVYLMGEMHGAKENAYLFGQYLEMLAAASDLRDVALEEDNVYERAAQAYVDGKQAAPPEALCLRANILEVIRQFNQARGETQRIRVHLVDLDMPATAIRDHLLAIQAELPAAMVRVPAAGDIRKRGLRTVEDLRRLTSDERLLGELRTIAHSIRVNQQGLEVGITGEFKGSPYLDDREEAIFRNIQDLVRERGPVLVFYGSDHISKALRKDGGPNRDQEFAPLARRLDKAGVNAYSVVTYPLAGSVRWRTGVMELPWTAEDGSLESREALGRMLAALPPRTLLHVDRKRHRIRLPSQDATAYSVDAFLLFPLATPMEHSCPPK